MADVFRILLATGNPGKVAEMRALLADLPVALISAAEYGDTPEVVEDAPTLEGNARKKALVLHEHTGMTALADDTGLEVDALGGRPGVHSARYAGEEADPAANRALLLQELEGVSDRSARFRTVVAYTDGEVMHYFEGVCEGRIIDEERGSGGFGYDALFVPEGYDRTFAELSEEAKNAVSHRGRALRAFAGFLRERLA